MRWLSLLVAPALAVVTASPAHADDEGFLNRVRLDYFSRSFTDSQLLAEGYKVCSMSGRASDDQLINMVASDLGVSENGAMNVVVKAQVWLGC
ncbi:DUF732 domain-containing protein [Mycolicibacterium sp. CBMA 226]|uniref:DUF732 domain-containing protein n=1 Tax=Mycolicibacterium sp. CBMA 226 TaxID=2606611 RepID=UPI001412B7EF|nr:DUF732 domain-containing protein [Mycolicibacterium sp. CBMA 226]